MSLFHDAHVVMRSFPDWINNIKKKEHGSGRLVLNDPESIALFADKFIVKSKFVVDYLSILKCWNLKGKREQKKRQS